MNKREVIKMAANFLASAATGALVAMVVKTNAIPTNMKEKIAVGIGGIVVSAMISDKAGEYVDKQIDDIYERIDEIKASIDDMAKQKQPVLVNEEQ